MISLNKLNPKIYLQKSGYQKKTKYIEICPQRFSVRIQTCPFIQISSQDGIQQIPDVNLPPNRLKCFIKCKFQLVEGGHYQVEGQGNGV